MSLNAEVAADSARSATKAAPRTRATLTCTVRSIDTTARALDLIIGVGHALRLVRMQVDATCQIKASGGSVDLKDLEPGLIVRVNYVPPVSPPRPADRPVAHSIEILSIEPEGSER